MIKPRKVKLMEAVSVEFVEPIRDKKKLEGIKRVLLGGNHHRDYLLFVLGINTGLRVSDLLELKWSDVLENSGSFKNSITIREEKTGKAKSFPLNDSARKALTTYMEQNQITDHDRFIFASREGANKPITRQRAWQIINEAAEAVGIKEQIGTHTLRKTFGYHARMAGTPIEVLQKLFNHSAPSVTMRYIGITQDEINDVYLNLNL
jgi:site-specific recombinase XerD